MAVSPAGYKSILTVILCATLTLELCASIWRSLHEVPATIHNVRYVIHNYRMFPVYRKTGLIQLLELGGLPTW